MKLLTAIWFSSAPWKAKRLFLCKLASEAAASGDLVLAIEVWRYVQEGDKRHLEVGADKADDAFYGYGLAQSRA